MKTRKSYALVLSMLMFSGCAKEAIPPAGETGENNPDVAGTISITLNASQDETAAEAEAKAAFNDGQNAIWVLNENKAGIVAPEKTPVASESIEVDGENKSKATIGFSGLEAGSYRLFYPYNEESSYDKYVFTVPSVQTQKAAGESGDFIFLLGGVKNGETGTYSDIPVTSPGTADVKYKGVGAMLRFKVYGKPGEKVKSISVSASEKSLSGKVTFGNDASVKSISADAGNTSATVTLETPYVTLTKEQTTENYGIYLSVLPGEYKGLKYIVTTNCATYTCDLGETSKTIESGSLQSIPLNLENASVGRIEEELYIFGTAINGNWNLNEGDVAKMTLQPDGTFTAERWLMQYYYSSEESKYLEGEFKFIKSNSSYSNQYVKGEGAKDLVYCAAVPSESEDRKFGTPYTSGLYRITADLENLKADWSLLRPENIYIHGTGNEKTQIFWNTDRFNSNAYLSSGDVIFLTTVDKTAKWIYVAGESGELVFNETLPETYSKFNIDTPDYYNVTVSFDGDGKGTFSRTPADPDNLTALTGAVADNGNAKECAMTKDGGSFKTVARLSTNGFKFADGSHIWGKGTDGNLAYKASDNFTPAADGIYNVTVTGRTVETTPWSHDKLFIVGSATSAGWDFSSAIKMNKAGDGDGIYSLDIHLNEGNEFKFPTESGNGGLIYVKDAGSDNLKFCVDDPSFSTELNHNFKTPSVSGLYRVTVNIGEGTMTCEMLRPDKMYLIGNATSAGWDTSKAVELSWSSENSEFTWTGEMYAGDFKFLTGQSGYWPGLVKASDDSNDLKFFASQPSDSEDRKFNVTAGNYEVKVKFDGNKLTVSVIPVFDHIVPVGNATENGWSVTSQNDALKMTREGEGHIYSAVLNISAGELKFTGSTTTDWGNGWWISPMEAGEAFGICTAKPVLVRNFSASGTDPTDKKWTVDSSASGTYKISIDIENATITIVKQE